MSALDTCHTHVSGLRLFVWEGADVLPDYTSGMICVLAHDLPEALALIREKDEFAMGSFPPDRCRVVDTPEAFVCWGGS